MKRRGTWHWLPMLIPLLLTTLHTQAAAFDVDGDRIARLDAYLQEEMRSLAIPGMAVAVVRGDRIIHRNGFGQADETGRPMTPQTPMWIGSVSKPITAMAMMQLVEQGKVDLEARFTPISPASDWRMLIPPASRCAIC